MDEFRVKVNNGEKIIRCRAGANLREVLLSEGIELGVCGGRGVCGKCSVKTDASGELTDAEKNQQAKGRLEDGQRLACQVDVQGDISVELEGHLEGVNTFKAVCREITSLTSDIRLFRFEVEGEPLDYRPGQYVLLTVPAYECSERPVTRTFSIASDPADKSQFELIIRQTPNGLCTKYLFEHLKEGEVIEFEGPEGDFGLTQSSRPAVMIAGGSGMSSIRNLLFEMKNAGDERPATYFFGAETEDDIYMLDEMREFEKTIPNFKFVPVIHHPSDSWHGQTGLVTDALKQRCSNLSSCEAFLCGSPGMINASIDVLKSLGVSGQNIYYDSFG
ncbi:NADH:ubiquinone reductase (Na(+)-transporting) subunit F [Sedimentisphaera salicampi]|uniref:Naphthalene 1,2-dioxygenase system ferredoxin--NAD(+) reductase component n=1 Tax=Sedimentisphaera salicampi TaxID=1941349 RepID=A0A1W6LMX2_9BACT|nr:2Fe-2S iron-sulfur cluster binding domain-containing protein [Sedimentisphaera salicampi]ARN57138.1 Naphthalene 1,2-dioxygenase system ferredoxin--NAD(+) reductase component [Sedimentisphaera salicampi]OXU14781.1 Naphthalene 1,2-dioxygenase system ferredoxin--NAD(+) reductase component [Sedimentisphaera salicampi]